MPRGLRPAIKLGLGLGIIALLLAWQPLGAYAAAWRTVAAAPVIVAFALLAPMIVLRTWQTALLARWQDARMPFGPLLALQLATAFYGLFLPGIVATGLLRWRRLAGLGGKPEAMLALITFSRLVELETLLGLGLGFCLADPQAPGGLVLPTCFAGLLTAVLLVRSAAFHPRLARWLIRLSQGRSSWLVRKLQAVLGAMGRFGSLPPRAWAGLLLLVFASHGIGLVSLRLLADAVGMQAGWATLGWARAVVGLALLLPVTWGGIGLREATLAGALTASGQPAAAAVTIGLLLSLRGLLEAGVGGLVELCRWLAHRGGEVRSR